MFALMLVAASRVLPLVAQDAGGEPGRTGAEAGAKRHPIAGWLAPRGRNVAGLDLWPHELPVDEAEEFSQRGGDVAAVDPDALVAWIEQAHGPDVFARIDDDGALLVDAPPPQQAAIRALLDALERELARRPQLSLRLIGGAADPGAPVFERKAESARREARLLAQSGVALERAATSPLAPGLAVALLQQTASDATTGWQLEIAHGAVVYAPITEARSAGLRALARAGRLAGATRLELAFSSCAPLHPVRRRSVAPKVWYTSPLPHELDEWPREGWSDALAKLKGTMPFHFLDTLELETEEPADRVASVATTIDLADGHVAWIPVALATTSGRAAATLLVELEGEGGEPIVALPGAATGRERVLLRRGAWESAGFDPARAEHGAVSFRAGDPMSFARGRGLRRRAIDVAKRLETLLDEWPHEQDPRVLELGPDLLLVESDAVAGAPLARLVASLLVPGRPLEVRVRVLHHGRRAAELAVPATTGRRVSCVAGSSLRRLFEWDVDVANQAAGGTPQFDTVLDGCALDILVTERAGGRCEIAVEGVVQLLDAPPEPVATGNPFAPEVDPLRGARVELDERAAVELSGDRGTLRLGGHPIAVEIEVRLGASAAPDARIDAIAPVQHTRWHALPALAAARFVGLDGFELAPVAGFVPEIAARVDEPDGEAARVRKDRAEFEEDDLLEALGEIADRDDVLIGTLHGDRLHVTADERGHRDVLRVLEQLDRATLSTARVEVRVVGGSPLVEAATIVPFAEADRLFDEVRDAGRAALVRSASSALQDGRDAWCNALALDEPILDFEAEIAHGAVIYDEIVYPAPCGLAAAFAGARTPHGVRLDFAIRQQERASRRTIVAEPRPLLGSPFPGEALFHLEEHALRIDAGERWLFSAAGSVELPDGCALLLPCRVATHAGECAGTLDVRVTGARKPGAGSARARAAALPAGFELPALDHDPLLPAYVGWTVDEDLWPSRAVHRGRRADEPLADAEEAPRHYQLTARVHHLGEPIAEFSTATLPDRAALLWAGALGNWLRAWEIDTAGEAKIGNPELATSLDGLFLSARIAERRDGGVSLTLRGAVQHRAGPIETLRFANPDSPLVQRFDAARRVFDEQLESALNDGVATFTLAGTPIAVEIEVRRLELR